MKTFMSTRGPFPERPYYLDTEIERTCAEELRGAGLHPGMPEPVRIDRFIEKRFGLTIAYDDLGPGILGYTRFGKSGVLGVVVSRTLDEDGTSVAERRVRSTLAHEAGHCLFHAHLFLLTGQCALFPEGATAQPRVLCRDERVDGSRGYTGQWWEYQANRAIGALLLPQALVRTIVSEFTEPSGSMGLRVLPKGRRDSAIRRLSEAFDVNPAVARIRLDQLAPVEGHDQPTL